MPNTLPTAPASPFASILGWSATWPDWQRDALRRIIGTGPLTADDVRTLASMCRAKHGLVPATGTAPTPSPLTAAHTPGGADGTTSVSLKRLSAVTNVGRIPSDQEIVFGTAPGLTVIYGENGAGKSGYARVIKRACRARGTPQEIKPNAFAAAPGTPATAKIECRVGAVDTPVDWKDGSPTDPRLGNIFVFDAFSARAHVGDDGPACFKPRGLDVLPELAKACDLIKAGLQTDIDAAYAQNTQTAAAWTYKAATKVGALITALGPDTKPETIEAAAVFTETDEKKLAEITATLNADPRMKAADTAAAAKRIRDFATTAKSRATSVDDTAMQTIGDALNEADATAKAAKTAAGPELKPGDLPGSCNAVWLKLWEAARAFSVADAYPGKEYPVTENGARCVLCQQDLGTDAVNRYSRFNKFVTDETRKQASVAKASVDALKPGVDLLTPIATAAAGIKADLDREAVGSFAAVETFAKAVDTRIAHAQKCLRTGLWSDAAALPPPPAADLTSLADRLDARAKSELAAAEPEKAKALGLERDELTDRKWLVGKKPEVLDQIRRFKLAGKLKECQDDCTTNTITIKSGELHDAHVTAAFCTAFSAELGALNMKTLPVKLEAAKGAKGERRFGIKLDGTTSAKVSDVASEGEHRCIALAAFLAELSQASHRSALVFDDPVSSLDHKRRDAIASRLVKEAKQRQVIVFTHDLALVCDLQTAARDEGLEIHYQHVEWLGSAPGRVLHGLLWDAQSCKEQMKTLNEQVGKADKIHREQGETEYRAVAMPVVDRVRGACERIIEEHLLNNVVRRHDSKISVGHMESVAVVTVENYKSVHGIWRDTSNIIEAHAKPRSGPVSVPSPDDIKKWVSILEGVIEAVRTARKSAAAPAITETKPDGARASAT